MLEKSSLYKLEKRLGLSAFGEYPDPFHIKGPHEPCQGFYLSIDPCRAYAGPISICKVHRATNHLGQPLTKMLTADVTKGL